MDVHLRSPDTRDLKNLGGNLVLKFKKSIYLFSVGRNQSSKICPFLTPIVSGFFRVYISFARGSILKSS